MKDKNNDKLILTRFRDNNVYKIDLSYFPVNNATCMIRGHGIDDLDILA